MTDGDSDQRSQQGYIPNSRRWLAGNSTASFIAKPVLAGNARPDEVRGPGDDSLA
jgi:hypothetical protein